jgi:hypothetical protein
MKTFGDFQGNWIISLEREQNRNSFAFGKF